MVGQAERQANGGRRGRDAALTWEVPPPLEAGAEAAASGRPAFAAVAGRHLEALVAQLLDGEGVAEAAAWGPRICELAQAAAAALSPTAAAATGRLDPRHYIKVKRVVAAGASPSDSFLVLGVACRKSLAHKRMRSSIAQPRIMLLGGGIEVARSGLGSSAAAAKAGGGGGGGMVSLGSGLSSLGGSGPVGAHSKLSSFDSMLDQEQQYLGAVVDRIASFNPDVLLVEGSVARYAQELLLARDISLVLNVKPELLERIARCTGAQVAPSADQLSSHCVGFCKEFEVESVAAQQAQQAQQAPENGVGSSTAPASAAASAEPSPRTPEAPDAQHLVAAEVPLRRTTTSNTAPRALMTFRGCPRPLGATIVLRGSDAAELRKVKRIASFAAYAAFWGVLESAMLANQLAAAAAAVLPGSGSGSADALAGLADAVASTSYLATAEARGRQAILSASPHVSITLERGASHQGLDLPSRAAAPSAAEADDADAADTAAEETPPESPASSDSTNLWVLPAEAGAATFTVSGSQTEADDEQQGAAQWQAAARAESSGTSTPGGNGSSSQAPPGSPQDPLHVAAKELALQQLQLTGSRAASPEDGSGLLGVSGDTGAAPPGGTQQLASHSAHLSRDGEGAAAPSLAAALTNGLGADPSACSAQWGECGGGGSGGHPSPALAAYHTQRLWLAISCKNPAKGILCEPSHAHCMEFYADTDLPLAAFMSAAAPPNRKCPHPQCGEGAPLHLRSFMHGGGLVTLSSMRLPAGKELPDGRFWLWLRPCGDAGQASPSTARRVPLSPEAACLSFAHLLSLLLDCRHLSLGGLSLQRDFVRYLGAGHTLLCLHYSPIHPYRVCMPPRQVQLAAEPELEWLQEELKQLTEEADEAFSAIEYALTQQLDALERQQQAPQGQQAEAGEQAAEGPAGGGDGADDPEFRAMWLGTLADTRGAFLDMIQDAVGLLDGSPHGVACGSSSNEQALQAARRVTSTVWELNRLRSMLAAVVVQWATCLHEGTPGSHAAPPASASALSTALASRRLAAGHSRHASLDVLPPREGLVDGAEEQAEASLLPSSQPAAGSMADQQQQPAAGVSSIAGQDQQSAPASEQLSLPHLPAGPASSSPIGMQLRRDRSDSSLAHHFLQASSAPPPATLSELNFGAPSLVGGEEVGDSSPPGDSSPTYAAQLQSRGQGPGQAPIPTGLVARYVALFDQRSSSTGSGGGSPSSPGMRSQRTRDWVQRSSQQDADAAGAGPGAAGPAQAVGEGVQQAPVQVPPPGTQQAQQAQQQRRPPFRLDLSNPDPELVRALTPKRRNTTDEAEAEAAPHSSRLEQVAARLGRMSLSKSFTERRRSYSHLKHALSADQASIRQHLAAAAAQPSPQPVAEHQAEQRQEQQQQAEQQQREQQPEQQAQTEKQAEQQRAQDVQQVPVKATAGAVAAAAGGDHAPPSPAGEPSGRGSVSHWEWNSLLDVSASPEDPGGAAELAPAGVGPEPGAADEREAGSSALVKPLGPLRMLQSAASGRLEAIARLQDAPMPATLAAAGADAAAEANGVTAATAAAGEAAAAAGEAGAPAAAAAPSSRASTLLSTSLGPLGALMSSVASQLPSSTSASAPVAAPQPLPLTGSGAAGKLPAKQPSKLLALLGKLRSELAPGHLPLTAGRVELSGRALLPGGADGMRVAIFDDEPTSVIAYFLATKEYQGYLHDSVAGILFGQPGPGTGAPSDGAGSNAAGGPESESQAAALPASWQSLPDSPRGSGNTRGSSLVPGLQAKQPADHQQQAQQQQQQGPVAPAAGAAPAEPAPAEGADEGSAAAADAAAPAVRAEQAAPPPPQQQQQAGVQPEHSGRTVTQEELAAEQSGDWQVLFCEQQLDCQLAMEDPSPGMPWGRARFQVTAYYAPQFAELRRRVVAGGEPAFLASISRCRKWATRGGKSAVYFARTHDKRYIIKQLSRSERQSFLEFAPDYFRYVATMLHRGEETCLAKILGVYQVSVQYTGGRGAPAAPPFGGKEGVMDLLITENVFYGRDAQVSRIYDLKGSQRDRYAADDPTAAGAVLLDENLKELNLTSPTLVGPQAFARLQRALWSDSGFLAGLGVMDYSLLVGVDKSAGELVVGVIDYIRQYTWDKQVETWVKKSGILGGAGKDPTVISPKQYSRRFRVAMSSYLTVVPAWEAPAPPLDPDAM